MSESAQKRPIHVPVAIIGGGFSGAAVAWHLLRRRPELARVVIIEPRAELGRGLAYSAADPSHRINVPATRMSLLPDHPTHFNDWLEASGALEADPAARRSEGRNFPARAVFGTYVAAQLAALGPRVQHVAAAAEAVEARGDVYRIHTSDGATLEAGIVVLAVAHAPPSPPSALARALAGHPRFLPDPWKAGALDAVRPDDRVLIVGTGLTMADLVATLDRIGHRGAIVALSRRGLRSRGHPAALHDPYGDFATDPARTAGVLVRRIRAAVAQAVAEGKSWHCVLDQVRLQGSTIWNALPLHERARLLRHLRPFWDVHRFRIAPQVEEVLDQRIAAGTLRLRAASLQSVERSGEAIAVSFRDRRTGAVTQEVFDAVLTATGPAHGRVFADNPVLAALERAGLARPDKLRLGIEVAGDGRAIGRDGAPTPDLFVVGPLARGTVGELMGLPDVTNYAIRIAETVAARLEADANSRAASACYGSERKGG
ncbi:FAD/NAD(P)-binding protein [Ancylobacter polymorphus]|uniref:NAD(P)/FAD-binding protein YdhS n=1 Tax=Ancylobacter polymorphus TaxID=223390 RepID=A0ABU0B9R5_9HYPH|nr:FAD/NAD(P)-binding protein [Ancylobacter polymorphus]MDQ0302571.1 putative NAD(P)/FAD-binding protein YdhS [Ancylobacter polymorphus]